MIKNTTIANSLGKLNKQIDSHLNEYKLMTARSKLIIITAFILILLLSVFFEYMEMMLFHSKHEFDWITIFLSTIISTSGICLVVFYYKKLGHRNDSINQMLLNLKDITDSYLENQLQTIKELDNEKSKLENVIEFLPDATFAVDKQGAILFWNSPMEKITGLNKSEVLGKQYSNLTPYIYGKEVNLILDHINNGNIYDQSISYSEIYKKIKIHGNAMSAEVYLPNAYNGRGADVWVTASPFLNSNGEKVGIIESVRDITQNKEMEGNLIKSQQFNQDVLDSLNEHIAVIDNNGMIIAVNNSWETFARENNSDPESVGLGVNYLKVCRTAVGNDSSDAKVVLEGIQSIIDGQKDTFIHEYSCHSPEEKRWFLLYASSLNNSEGVVVSHINITQRKEKEELLERYQLLSQYTTDIILFINEEGQIIEANDTALISYGYTREEMLTLSIHSLRGSNSHYKTKKQMIQAQEESLLFEAEHYRKDGSSFPVEVNSTGIKIGNKNILLSIIRDISERKEHQKQLEEMKLRNLKRQTQVFTDMFQAVPIGVMLLDNEYKIKKVNDPLLKMKSTSASNIIGCLAGEGLDCCFLIDCPDGCGTGDNCKVCRFRCAVETTLTTGISIKNLEAIAQVFIHNKPASIMFRINTVRVNIEGENYVVMSLEDITQYKNAQGKLHEAVEKANIATKAKSDFLAKMSHEIRTPMNGILGMADLALSTELSTEQREYLGLVKTSANNLMTIINDILDYSKIEAAKLELKEKEFDLSSIINDTIKILRVKAEKKGIKLDSKMAKNLPRTFIGDPIRIQQILFNLIANAIKFTDEGQVTVNQEIMEINHQENKIVIRIAVIDTGIGIPEDKMAFLFESFSQLNNNGSNVGTGLGLAISKQLVEMMGGKIEVTSKVNEGSSFTFNLHLAYLNEKDVGEDIIKDGNRFLAINNEEDSKFEISNVENIEEYRTVDKLKKAQDSKILIAEDNPINQKLLSSYLSKKGYQFKIASNGKLALDLYKKYDFSIMLVDIMMPDINGYELIRMVRKLEIKSKTYTPIIALTASALDEDREKCMGMGADAFISKPIDFKEFHSTILRCLNKKKDDTEMGIHVDINKIPEVMLEDKELLNDLVDRMLDSYPKTILEFNNLLERKKYNELKNAMHKFKGTILNFGAIRAISIVEDIESCLLEMNYYNMAEDIRLLEDELEYVKIDLINIKRGDISEDISLRG